LVKSDAKLDAPVLRLTRVAFRHRVLNIDGTTQCRHRARELDEDAVAGDLDDAALVLRDFGVDQLLPVCLQPLKRTFLVSADEPAVARHVGGQYRCQLAFDALGRHRETSLSTA
jgi:hypothetical protein